MYEYKNEIIQPSKFLSGAPILFIPKKWFISIYRLLRLEQNNDQEQALFAADLNIF